MRTFDCETTQQKWDQLSVRQVSDAARKGRPKTNTANAGFESSLTIGALEAQLAEENAVDLVDPIVESGPWAARERARKLLAAMNRRNRDFYGGKPAA